MTTLSAASAPDYPTLIRTARSVCRRAGYPVNSDPEYDSAINLAVCLAVAKWKPGERSLSTTACFFALCKCEQASRTIARWRRQDRAGASRPQGRERGSALLPEPVVIPLLDRQVLEFVASYGRSRSARLLCMSTEALNRLIDDIFLRNPELLRG